MWMIEFVTHILCGRAHELSNVDVGAGKMNDKVRDRVRDRVRDVES